MTDTIDITPEANLPKTLWKTWHKLEEALAELIDNSIDAMIDNEVKIDITVTNDEVRISDNWSWMDLNWLKNALTLWHSEKEGKLWKYGLWLKTSCFAMWDCFEIVTKKEWDEFEYSVIFDAEELANRKEWTLPYEKRKANVNDHYTFITINNLKIKNPLKKMDDVIDELQMRFSNFLEDKKDNILIKINDQKLEVVEIEVIKDPEIYTKIDEDTNYWRITWWASLMPKGSQSWWKYWLHCYWNGRLIKQFNKIWFKSHPTFAHLFGKINLDFVDVQHDKKDFITDSPEYKEAEEILGIKLKPLLRKSANFDKLEWWKGWKKPIKKIKGISEALQQAVTKWLKNNKISCSLPWTKDIYVWDASKITEEVKDVLKNWKKSETIYSIELSHWEKINFSFEFKPLWDWANYLVYDYNPEGNYLRIFSNSDSTIFNACEDISFLSALHAAEWLARFILKSWNKANIMDEYFKLFTLILEQTCSIYKK